MERLDEQARWHAREAAQQRQSAHEGLSGRLERAEQSVRGVRSECAALQAEVVQMRSDAHAAEQACRVLGGGYG